MDKLQQAFQSGFQKEAQKGAARAEELSLGTDPYDLGIASSSDNTSRAGLAAAHGAIGALGLGATSGGAYAAATGNLPGQDVYRAATGSPGNILGGVSQYMDDVGIKNLAQNPSMKSLGNLKARPIMSRFGKGTLAGAGLALGTNALMNLGQYGLSKSLTPDSFELGDNGEE